MMFDGMEGIRHEVSRILESRNVSLELRSTDGLPISEETEAFVYMAILRGTMVADLGGIREFLSWVAMKQEERTAQESDPSVGAGGGEDE